MSKTKLLFRGPIETRSGYGSHARDLLLSLRDMELFEIVIDSCPWGNTPKMILEKDNEFHQWMKSKIVTQIDYIPDIYIQVTVPNEFRRLGKMNIGITAGIETTIAPKDWIDGCNQMDLVITTSNFSRDVLLNTKYAEIEKGTGRQVNQHSITKRIEVLFEGVDRKIYNNKPNPNFDLKFENPFCFLFVGHWLKGDIGEDRKNVGLMIKLFAEQFSNMKKQPALILKTSSVGFSVKERETLKKRIQSIVKGIENPPPIYLLFGDLSDEEMNSLYNHPNIKAMISLTKGEGFGRPLLEFTMTGKPVIASNWSGQKDFLSDKNSILLGGTLTDVHESAIDKFVIKESKWFSVDNNEAKEAMKMVFEKYKNFKKMSENLRIENENKFGMNQMTNVFRTYLEPYLNKTPTPIITKLNLPKLNKIN